MTGVWFPSLRAPYVFMTWASCSKERVVFGDILLLPTPVIILLATAHATPSTSHLDIFFASVNFERAAVLKFLVSRPSYWASRNKRVAICSRVIMSFGENQVL